MANGHGGTRAGAGRKSKAEELALGDLLCTAWPEADRIEVIKAMAIKAALGDVKAAELLLAYAYGKPQQRVELTGKGGGPLEIDDVARREAAQELAEWRHQMSALLPNISSAPPTPPMPATPTE